MLKHFLKLINKMEENIIKQGEENESKILYFPKNNFHKPVITENKTCWQVIVIDRRVRREIID